MVHESSAATVLFCISSVFLRFRNRVINALALYLARPLKHYGPSTIADPQSLSATLRPGDVLLTQGNTRMAALVRHITGSPWSHVSMYVGPREDGPDPRCIVEADIAAGVSAIPLSELKGLNVRILRPAFLRDADRHRLADWVVSRIGDEYDVAHAWALARRLLRVSSTSRRPPAPSATAQGAARFICSSLLAQAFLLVGYPIVPAQLGVRAAGIADHRYVTPRDFESAAMFEVVRAAPVG
jgi:Permuted papain-like amidase enzyme, YaeF/YiiX, C92 family